MSDMSVDTVFQTERNAKRAGHTTNTKSLWMRLGQFMERLATYCGSHASGYIAVPLDKQSNG